jgi:hypothetical protein
MAFALCLSFMNLLKIEPVFHILGKKEQKNKNEEIVLLLPGSYNKSLTGCRDLRTISPDEAKFTQPTIV